MSQVTHTQKYSIHPFAAELPAMGQDEFDSLKASIKLHGLNDPIRIYNNQVLDGRHRYQACLELGITPKILPWDGNDKQAKDHVFAQNVSRRHLSTGQRSILAARSAGLEKGQNAEPTARKTGQSTLTQDQAANFYGVSPDSIQRARFVLKHGDQALIARVERGELSVNAAKEEILAGKVGQKLTNSERRALAIAADIKAKQGDLVRNNRVANTKKQNAKNKPLAPEGKRYSVILADPPWKYDQSESGSRFRIENKYPTMPLKKICEMPVEKRANRHAMLFLWCPSPLLPDGLEVMRAWGFDYVASAVWAKKGGRKSHMGGSFRVHHEYLLIGKRGDGLPKPKTKSMRSSVIEAPASRHSAKPLVVHEILEQLYPEFADERIELFARKPRMGWDVWGNEAEGTAKQSAAA